MLDLGKNKVAVDKVSFNINNGEVFGLLGVNGAGKTTTFKMLTGEIRPTSGTAYVAGLNIRDNMEEARKHVGYCP
jgi:ATP-binding cassette subfamily A (ABC1) protein 3